MSKRRRRNARAFAAELLATFRAGLRVSLRPEYVIRRAPYDGRGGVIVESSIGPSTVLASGPRGLAVDVYVQWDGEKTPRREPPCILAVEGT